MKKIIIEETKEIKGSISAPSSKSYSHRSIIASSLSKSKSIIFSPLICNDTLATINACSLLGAYIEQKDDKLIILGSSELKAPNDKIDCRESGSTIRFLTPIAALAKKGKIVLTGNSSLRRRPIGALVDALQQLKVNCVSNKGFPPVTVFCRGIKGGNASLVGDVSSQFVTGLLLACPMAENNTEISLITPLESKPYIELTLDIIKKHEIKVNASKNFRRFIIQGGQEFSSNDHHVPGDYSSASYLLGAAAILNSHIKVENLYLKQPDVEIINILDKMGINIKVENSLVEVFGGTLKGAKIDARDIPDLVPVCTVLACFSEGTTHIFNAGRLRIKETNRLTTLPSELHKMGANIVENPNGLMIKGVFQLRGTKVTSHNDHRIAMACAIAALKAKGKTQIFGAECVNKSYPNFFMDLKKLGGNIYDS